jgi:hypothetical protein
VPLPGEVSRAHHGILYLGERPDCTRLVLKVYDSRSRMDSYNNHGAQISNVVALTALSTRRHAPMGSHSPP